MSTSPLSSQSPIMTTVHNRPTLIQEHLSSSNGVLVQCRLPSGEDAFVPLSEIIAVTAREIAAKIRMNGGAN